LVLSAYDESRGGIDLIQATVLQRPSGMPVYHSVDRHVFVGVPKVQKKAASLVDLDTNNSPPSSIQLGMNSDSTVVMNQEKLVTQSLPFAISMGGSASASITLKRGGVYEFKVNTKNQPFFLSTSAALPPSKKDKFVPDTFENEYLNGVTNSRADIGIVGFTVPYDAPDKLYYRSGSTWVGGGEIIIQDEDDTNETSVFVETASSSADFSTEEGKVATAKDELNAAKSELAGAKADEDSTDAQIAAKEETVAQKEQELADAQLDLWTAQAEDQNLSTYSQLQDTTGNNPLIVSNIRGSSVSVPRTEATLTVIELDTTDPSNPTRVVKVYSLNGLGSGNSDSLSEISSAPSFPLSEHARHVQFLNKDGKNYILAHDDQGDINKESLRLQESDATDPNDSSYFLLSRYRMRKQSPTEQYPFAEVTKIVPSDSDDSPIIAMVDSMGGSVSVYRPMPRCSPDEYLSILKDTILPGYQENFQEELSAAKEIGLHALAISNPST